MTEAMLKQWVNGTLSSTEEHEVARWMVRCTDPALPGLLMGMMREVRESEADAAQSLLGSAWEGLVSAWNTLLDAGTAGWSEPGMGLQPASLDAGAPPADMLIVWGDDDDALAVSVAGDGPSTVVLTDLAGTVMTLQEAEPGVFPVPLDAGTRPTIWVIRGRTVHIDTVDELNGLIAEPDTDVNALRWRD